MKKLLLLTILLLPSIAFAQERKDFTFTINQDDLNVIGKALEDRPFKEAAPIIQKLNAQIQSQMKPVQPMATKPEAKE